MPRPNWDSTVLVVVERDAACMLWMPHWGPEPETWALLEHEPEECSEAFADRLELVLRRFAGSTETPATIVFVLGRSADAATTSERWERASLFLYHLATTPHARMVLTSGYGDEHALCAQALAEDLTEEFEEHPVEIVVRGPNATFAPRLPAARTARPEMVA